MGAVDEAWAGIMIPSSMAIRARARVRGHTQGSMESQSGLGD